MYEFHTRIRYSELDEQEKLSLHGMINYFQDTSNFHSESLGVGLDYANRTQQLWVLLFWQIVIERYPQYGEEICVGTQPYEFTQTFGLRNFAMTDKSGKMIVKANSVWALMDGKTRRAMRIPKTMGEIYVCAPPLEMDYAPRKIKLPEEMIACEPVKAMPHMIDSNRHVNNGQYVQIAEDLLPSGTLVKEVRVEYKKQAMLGDVIIPYMGKKENCYVYSLRSIDGSAYATVQMYV